MKDKKIFHTPDERPDEGKSILIQFESGSYGYHGSDFYDISLMKVALTHKFKMYGYAIRWCYIDDLDNIE
jgi:hypothetical protein